MKRLLLILVMGLGVLASPASGQSSEGASLVKQFAAPLIELFKAPLKAITEPVYHLSASLEALLKVGDHFLEELNNSDLMKDFSRLPPAMQKSFHDGEKAGWLLLSAIPLIVSGWKVADPLMKGYENVRLVVSLASLLNFFGVSLLLCYSIIFQPLQKTDDSLAPSLILHGLQHGLVYPVHSLLSILTLPEQTVKNVLSVFNRNSSEGLDIRLAFSAGYLATQFLFLRGLTYLYSTYFPGTAANPVIIHPERRFAYYLRAYPALMAALHIGQELKNLLGFTYENENAVSS